VSVVFADVIAKKIKPVMVLPTFNYCDVMRGQFLPFQVIQGLIDQLAKFGRLVVPCPIKPGHYYVKNFYLDETQMPMYRMLRGDSLKVMAANLQQEVSRKMVPIYDVKVFFTFNNSNWP
jgi:Protein of unknown function (DUF1091)